jgi:Uma2 family endonuclease
VLACRWSADIVQPDLFFMSTARLGIITKANVQGAPDLAVEILSGSTYRRDEILKRQRYEQLGVLEYWTLDGRRQAVWILRRTQGSDFDAPTELTAAAGQVLTAPLLPGLEIALRDLFAQHTAEATSVDLMPAAAPRRRGSRAEVATKP